MNYLSNSAARFTTIIITIICLAFYFGASAITQTASPSSAQTTAQKGPVMSQHATGTFEVKIAPLTPYENSEGAKLSRMSIDKQFHGDLEAVSKGEMLAAGTDVKGSAGYVAIERVSGTLYGLTGTFVLQHTGTMTRGVPQLSVTVVPDSASGQLTGLTGKMDIIITDGKHSYVFDYTHTKKEAAEGGGFLTHGMKIHSNADAPCSLP